MTIQNTSIALQWYIEWVCVICGPLSNGPPFDSLNFNSLPSSALGFSSHNMRLMYTLLLQYDKSKYVDFATFFFLISILAGRTNEEGKKDSQNEWERKRRRELKNRHGKESTIVLHLRMQSKLVSKSNKRQELNSFPMFCCKSFAMCIRLLFFLPFVPFVPVAGEDECQKQI